MTVRDLSPLFESLRQWRRLAIQLASQLSNRKNLSPYEHSLLTEVECLDDEWAEPPQPPGPPPADDRWFD